jgi:N-acetylglucosamine kinase-like BadF-type ATPase
MGIDGSGPKTNFALADGNCHVMSEYETKGTSYRQYSSSLIINRLREGINTCLGAVDLKVKDASHICLRFQCHGESIESDATIKTKIFNAFHSAFPIILNDVEIGWTGAQNCRSSIHVVSGTGSIAFGKEKSGLALRCGGGFEIFIVEGSGYWLENKSVQLLSMQSDGRISKRSLNYLIRETNSRRNEIDFFDVIHRQYILYREKIACLQLGLQTAAKLSDESVIDLYYQATKELMGPVISLKKQIWFRDGVYVTFSDSLFDEKSLRSRLFFELIWQLRGIVGRPIYSPSTVVGTIMLEIV